MHGFKPDHRKLRVAYFFIGLAFLAAVLLLLPTSGVNWNTRLLAENHRWASAIFAILACFVFLYKSGGREWDPFAPTRLFSSVWLATLALGSLRLSAVEEAFTLRVWFLIACGVIGFLVGSFLSPPPSAKRPLPRLEIMPQLWQVDWSPSRTRNLVLAFAAVCSAAFLYEYMQIGVLPLLSEDITWARFNFGTNSYVHRFAISFYLVLFLSYLGFFHLGRNRLLYLSLGLLSFAVISLLTARVFLMAVIWTALVFFHYGRKPFTRKMIIVIVLVTYPAAKTAVDLARFHTDAGFGAILSNIAFPENLRIFAPDYIYLSMPQQGLLLLTDIVPDELDYSYGWYTFYPVRVLWTPRVGEGFRDRLDDLLWKPSLRRFKLFAVTTTYLGVPYADFGIPGVVGFSLIFGWMSARAYRAMRSKPSFWRVLLYSQFVFAIVHSFYSNWLTLFDMYWILAVVGLFSMIARRWRECPKIGTIPLRSGVDLA